MLLLLQHRQDVLAQRQQLMDVTKDSLVLWNRQAQFERLGKNLHMPQVIRHRAQ